LGIARNISDKYIEGVALFNMGIAQEKLGRQRIAVKNCKAGLEILKNMGHADATKMERQFSRLFPNHVP